MDKMNEARSYTECFGAENQLFLLSPVKCNLPQLVDLGFERNSYAKKSIVCYFRIRFMCTMR